MSCRIGFVRTVPVAPFNVRVHATVPLLRSFPVIHENNGISPSTELAGPTTSHVPAIVDHRSHVACVLSATSTCQFDQTPSRSSHVEYV